VAKTKTVKRYRRRKLTQKEIAKREAQAIRESTCLMYPSIVAFGKDTAIREAYRIWWRPPWDQVAFCVLIGEKPPVRVKDHGGGMRHFRSNVVPGSTIEFERLEPKHAARMRSFFRKRRGGPARHTATPGPTRRRAPVRVRIDLHYPLREKRSKVVVLDRRYPGEIFGLAHDFYRELYAEDERRGGKAGPMNGGKGPLVNRGAGPLIWGHDIADLVFEGVHYTLLKKNLGGIEGAFTFEIGS
jgi:hypothetical protein